MGVLGVILSFIILRYALRIDKSEEEAAAKRGMGHLETMTLNTFSIQVTNQMVFGDSIKQIRDILKRDFMVSKIIRKNSDKRDEVVNGRTIIEEGDILQIVAHPTVEEPITALLGEKVQVSEENTARISSPAASASPSLASTARASASFKSVQASAPTSPV